MSFFTTQVDASSYWGFQTSIYANDNFDTGSGMNVVILRKCLYLPNKKAICLNNSNVQAFLFLALRGVIAGFFQYPLCSPLLFYW